MYYLCVDDSNLLSSWPAYPIGQHSISTQLFLRHSKLCLKSLPRPMFSVPGNRTTTRIILETSDLFLTQLSFAFLINHHILYIQPLNCLKSTPFLHPHCHISNQGYHSPPETIRRSSCGYCYSIATLLSQSICPKSPKQSFFSAKLTAFFSLNSFNGFPKVQNM